MQTGWLHSSTHLLSSRHTSPPGKYRQTETETRLSWWTEQCVCSLHKCSEPRQLSEWKNPPIYGYSCSVTSAICAADCTAEAIFGMKCWKFPVLVYPGCLLCSCHLVISSFPQNIFQTQKLIWVQTSETSESRCHGVLLHFFQLAYIKLYLFSRCHRCDMHSCVKGLNRCSWIS